MKNNLKQDQHLKYYSQNIEFILNLIINSLHSIIFTLLKRQMYTKYKTFFTIILLLLGLFNKLTLSQDLVQGDYQTLTQQIPSNIISSNYEIPITTQLQKQTLNLYQQHETEHEPQLQDQFDTQTLQDQHNPLYQQSIKQQKEHQQSHYHTPHDAQFWWNLLLASVLTITGAFCSGVGVGFCNIDKLQLQVMTMSRNPYQRKMAKTIHQVVSNHHLWLCTLLVYNAIALQSLPLVVHTLMPDWMAIVFSTVIVLIGAQIVPQAVCTGPKKMIIAYYAAPIVNGMRKALFFIIHPIAKGLDMLLGIHNHQRIQHKDFATFLTGNKILKQTQKILLTSTLELRIERVIQKMIPIKKLYSLECSQMLSKQKVQDMLKKDYSHVLVYRVNKDQIVGVIKVKQFALRYLRSNQSRNLKAQDAMDNRTRMLSVYKDTNLLQMLMLFQANSNRIALVCDQKRKTASGIPSIMYTKNDMIMNKKGAKIIGAIFLYQIFDQLTNYQQNVPRKNSTDNVAELIQMKNLNKNSKQLQKPLIPKH